MKRVDFAQKLKGVCVHLGEVEDVLDNACNATQNVYDNNKTRYTTYLTQQVRNY